MTIKTQPQLKVAIVGAGPAGLAAAIQLRRLPNVDLDIFDQARELREIGAGITINENTWRLLQELGAADKLEQFTDRAAPGTPEMQHRNGHTGELLSENLQSDDPSHPPRSRIERYKLQNALLSQLPPNLIRLSRRLAAVHESSAGVTLSFEDGSSAGPYDLLVGADGLRSAVRGYAFPDHKLSYIGKVAFRVLIPQEKVAHIKGIPPSSCFWHTVDTHVYTCPLDNGLFEIAAWAIESEEHGRKVSWGQTIPKERVVKHYQDYTDTIRAVIDVPDSWLEFAMFGGPALNSVTHNGRIVLIGDASHPLSGAYGSGAAFAFEDAYVLKAVVEYSREWGRDVAYALQLFDEVRGPRYKGLHAILDRNGDNARAVKRLGLDPNEHIRKVVLGNWHTLKKEGDGSWIYGYQVEQVWAARREQEEASNVQLHSQRELPDLHKTRSYEVAQDGRTAASTKVAA